MKHKNVKTQKREPSKPYMIRKIYHGSSRIVRTPAFGTGSPYNDFGLGFYCTEYPQYAAEWASGPGRNGFVSEYMINDDGLRTINLCSSQYTPLHWLGLLFSYRVFDLSSDTAYKAQEYINKYYPVDYQACDCIIGYRADNRCFMLAQEFLDSKISYQSFRKALSGDESNRQFVLKSNRAFDRVSFTGYRTAHGEETYIYALRRELDSLKGTKQSLRPSDVFIRTMIEEEVRPYDSRLR